MDVNLNVLDIPKQAELSGLVRNNERVDSLTSRAVLYDQALSNEYRVTLHDAGGGEILDHLRIRALIDEGRTIHPYCGLSVSNPYARI